MARSFQAAVCSTCLAAATLGLSWGNVAAQPAPATTWSGSNSANSSSWLAGGLAGYNWQRGSMIFGFETDLSAMQLKSNASGFAGITSGNSQQQFFNSTSATIDWYGTVRGRLGVTSGPLLFYGTAGLAYGNVSLSSNFSPANNNTNGGVISLAGAAALALNQQASVLRPGWVAGAGVEYLMRPDISLTLSYQYVDLGSLSLAGSSSFSGSFRSTANQAASVNAHFNAVTAGLSWHFGAPSSGRSAYASMNNNALPLPPSNPWAGFYAGGRGGGAWGYPANVSTSASGVTVVSCFTATTAVLMADGTTRPIAEVRIGDQVVGENGEVNTVVDIETPFLGTRKLYSFNDGPGFVTREHPFLTRGGWKSIAPEATLAENSNLVVGTLEVGDELVMLGTIMTLPKPLTVSFGGLPQAPAAVVVETKSSSLESAKPLDGDPSMIVYNLRLDGNHTYFANNYLVHNK